MESPKFEKTSQAEKVALFLEKWRTVLIVVLALVIAVIVCGLYIDVRLFLS